LIYSDGALQGASAGRRGEVSVRVLVTGHAGYIGAAGIARLEYHSKAQKH
jgi:hypothetical protein